MILSKSKEDRASALKNGQTNAGSGHEGSRSPRRPEEKKAEAKRRNTEPRREIEFCMAQYYSMVGRPQISDSFWAFLKAFILFRMSAINHGVFSRGLGGNASSTRALTMGEGKVSGWAAMCATGLELIKRAGGKL